MAWNQPEDNKPKDPWGRDGKSKGGDKQPELDKVFKDIKKQFSGFMSGNNNGGKNGKSGLPLSRLLGMLALGLVAVFVFSGFYQVPAGQKAVVLFYGQVSRIADAGLHWYNPVLESLHLVTMEADAHYRLSGELATADGQLAKVGVDVSYKVSDPAAYVLAAAEPITLLQNLTLAQLRQLLGRNNQADLVTQPTAQWGARLQKQLQAQLTPWHVGLELTAVSITELGLPDAVSKAAAGNSKAQAAAQADLQQAQDYQQSQLLAAQGKAARMLAEAKAYQQKVVDYAEGETSRFNSLLSAYEKAPTVTRDRLYLETMEQVLGQTSKVLLMDNKAGQQLALPLAELIRGVKPAAEKNEAATPAPVVVKPAPKAKTEPAVVPSLYGEPSNAKGVAP